MALSSGRVGQQVASPLCTVIDDGMRLICLGYAVGVALPRRARTFTPQEYLSLERNAEYKSEYVNGEIFAMAGASPAHNRICMNLWVLLGLQLRGGACEVFGSDLRVAVDSTVMYTYPDAVIVCGESVFSDADNLLNARVLFEVLSPSTAAYDRGDKFDLYRKISSLTDYVLIAQDQPVVEHWWLDAGGGWVSRKYAGLNDQVQLDSIGCTIKLAEVYERLVWDTL